MLKALAVTFALLLGIGGAVTLFIPFPARIAVGEEVYACVWESGAVT